MNLDRGITKNGIISRRDDSEVMKIEVGGGKAAEIGCGKDGIEKGQREVGSDETCRWQKNREKGDEKSKGTIHLIVGRRDKGRKIVNETVEKLQRTRVAKTRDRVTQRQRRLRERAGNAGRKIRMATRRRTRSDVDKEHRGWRNPEKKEKGLEASEMAKKYQTVQEETDDEVEMLDVDQVRGKQTRNRVRKGLGSTKDKTQEGRAYGDGRSKRREEGGDFGSTSGLKNWEGRSNYKNKGRAGRGRGRGSRGRSWTKRKREEQETTPVRKYRKTLTKKIQNAEKAYCENTNEDIRRIIQQLEEEATQGQSDSEMEDWDYLLPYPGNTRGRMTQYKHTLHVY